jgi:hypothetical protein
VRRRIPIDIEGQEPELSVKEAGRKGGLTTFARYGVDYFREVGKKGQVEFAAKFGREQRSLWGAQGGRPKRHRKEDLGRNGQ